MLKGSLRISRNTSNAEPDYITIELEDDESCVHFAEVKVTLADFTRAVTGQHVPMTWEPKGLAYIGAKREQETRLMARPTENLKMVLREAHPTVVKTWIQQFERDGWKGRGEDVLNPHNLSDSGLYRVLFVRYVRPDGTPVLDAS